MAWSEQARIAAAEARRRKSKQRITVGRSGVITRAVKARALRSARKEWKTQPIANLSNAGFNAAVNAKSKASARNKYARAAWDEHVPQSRIRARR